ncbi:gluconate 2-dehydrogenase subunit 3 family protein [Pontibacter sp. G13]|uniref:gluconate 2-dehydrogenase subunit 3 family protein n=1 Tax=Pontibacter sp. G13 TaxID=3074898 RepID=UPI00288B26AE|nr:gluconate 2-dehydrogenase subunit 3 family protein [Pontibacter sp. G13]WNJ20964.1 gluconate 2-dehydrogenase subunit 3 family protein [Pontibacter sp. G13]
MDRRTAIQRVSLILGGTVVGAQAFLSGCATNPTTESIGPFSGEMIALLDEIADTILPDSPGVPGAKAAQVGPFMAMMVTDCYLEKERQTFLEGLRTFQAKLKEQGTPFLEMMPEQRTQFLNELDEEARVANRSIKEQRQAYAKDRTLNPPIPHYFSMMKQLTILGYFTSEIGATQALRYVESPGGFDPCAPYEVGDRGWAT